MKKYKIISFLLVAIFCMNIALPSITAFAVEGSSTEGSNIIYISSAEDLISLAKKCSLDIWSREKTVILMNNIDLSGIEFTSIPTFGGIFDGQGYTISGLSLTGYGSPLGLFCYVQEGALIKKLTVKGIVTPVGTKSIVGGVVGNNSGTIQNCIFNGVIRGDKYIGGIAGINQAKGLISNCSVQGIAYGEHNVGGIAGENLGTILLSTNEASINTTVEESSLNLENINNINIENLTSFSTADIVNILDIGGIAGFSNGIIQSCSNTGTVGYRSVGYNIGGIVGRQSGYVNGCTNNGIINGRKDVGGIAGQIEPYAFWELSENSLGKLRKELDTLQSLINTAINNTDQYSSAISTQLSTIGKYIADTRTAGDVLVDRTISLLNDNIDNINNVSARITQVLVAMEPIMGSFSAAIGDMKIAISKLKTAMEQLKIMSKGVEFGMYRLNPAFDKLDAALDVTREAFDNISNSLTSLKAGLGDPEAMKDALSGMQKGITSLIAGMVKIADGTRALYDAVNTLQDSEIWRENAPIIKNGINKLLIGVSKMNDALQAISDALIRLEGDFDEEKLSAALTSLESALANFAVGTEKLSSGISKISSGLEKIINAYKDNEAIQLEWYEEISEGVQEITSSMEDVQRAVMDLQDMLVYLQEANIDPEQTRKDLEAIMQGFADLAIATSDVIDVMIKINTATVRLLQSEEIKAFGGELVGSLQEIYDGVTQAIYAMERVNFAMNKLSNQIDFDKLSESIDYLKASIDGISSVIVIIQDIKPYVEAASPYFETASDYASQAFASAIEATASLEKSGAAMADAAAQIHNLISDLAKQPEISIKKVDSKYIETKDQFSQAFGETLNALSGLNSIISEASPILLADIKAISNQMFVVFDLLASAVENVSEMDTDIRDYTKDISTRDTDSDTFGKVADSINYGFVQGDINVGGITGSMAIEFEYDLEDEYNFIQKMSPNSKYLLRAIISDCENYGNIKSKKNCAGGIVGLMDFGYVKESIDSSSISSTGGNYVGGIAGKSDGTIRQCYVKSFLSGADFVGGIAGYGTNLYNCYSLIRVENAREFIGTIAGDGDGLWEGNYFVHDELAAVNRISYAGKAEPITYEELLSVEGLPEIFKTFRLTFVSEDEEIAIISFNYGNTIPENQIPHVPKKEGHFGKWETDDYKSLTFDATIKAVYEKYITTLASKHTRDNGLPVILVNGLFDKGASLTVTEIEKESEGERNSRGEKISEDEQNLIDRRISKGERDSTESCLFEGKQVLEEWTISVTDDGQATRKVHYLAPDQKTSDINIYLLKDGTWKKTKHTTKGKYLIFEMERTDATFIVISSEKNSAKVILIIMVISAVIATFLWLLRRRIKGKSLTGDLNKTFIIFL